MKDRILEHVKEVESKMAGGCQGQTWVWEKHIERFIADVNYLVATIELVDKLTHQLHGYTQDVLCKKEDNG